MSNEAPHRLLFDLSSDDADDPYSEYLSGKLAPLWPDIAPPDLLASYKHCSLSLSITDDETIAELNQTYRHKSGSTNVLSFPAPHFQGGDGTLFLGDVILALPTSQREALALGIPLDHHLIHLTLHGILHLLGYDHDNNHDANIMENKEKYILSLIDIKDPYNFIEQ